MNVPNLLHGGRMIQGGGEILALGLLEALAGHLLAAMQRIAHSRGRHGEGAAGCYSSSRPHGLCLGPIG